MVTSLTEMLEDRGKNCVDDVMEKNYDGIIFISKYIHFKKGAVVIFAKIIKNLTYLIETVFKDLKKIKKTRNSVSK